ncbi:MAG: Na/Pi cotransporter family protein [Gammaproteobacteria bacterium]|nr:MAG: Na/Pi cotransporter family protein [Gammaproteobacteria bacterium]
MAEAVVSEQVDLWRMLAGLGLFLFAMAQLEDALRAIGGRRLSSFLRERTSTPLRAVLAGTAATAILQSSSVVGLIVLAFTAAGLLPLSSALGVVFGANLGTTFTGWIVATLGFKVELDALVLPLVALGGLLYVFGREASARVGQITVGLGLLLMGLEFMKASVGGLADSVDVQRLAGFAPWQYLLFGVVFAGIIQSSSATMMVTLAALHAGVISLPNAAAIAIGADLGTTTTVLLGALKGSPSKRRVAVAHLIFNLVTDVIAFVLRLPLLALIAAVGIDDPLYALVAFHSSFNFIGLLIFVPLLKPFAGWLESHFARPLPAMARYLPEVNPAVVDAGLRAIERETARLIARVIRLNMRAFNPPLPMPPGRPPVAVEEPEELTGRFDLLYDGTKQLEGEILSFAARVQSQPLDEGQSRRISQLLSAVREAVHSTKQLKDIRHNLREFEELGSPRLLAYLDHFRSVQGSFYGELYSLRRAGQDRVRPEDLLECIQQVHEWHDQLHGEIYGDVSAGTIPQAETSSLLNVNRELLNSNLSLLTALADFHLSPEQALDFRRLPRTT